MNTPHCRYGTSKHAEPSRGSRSDVDHPVNGNPGPRFQPQATPIVPALGSPRQEDQVGPSQGRQLPPAACITNGYARNDHCEACCRMLQISVDNRALRGSRTEARRYAPRVENAPDAEPPRATFQREGQGQLQDPEHRLPSHVTGYAVLKTQRTGSIPRLTPQPPDSSGVVTPGQPITGDYGAEGGQPHQANISTPPAKPGTVTGVADALASASRPPTSGPVRALGGP